MPIEIVASVMPRDAAELRELGGRLGAETDLVEVRADRFAGTADELAAAIAELDRPTIVAARPTWEGGAFAGSEADRLAVLRAAARAASLVDVERSSSFAASSFAPARKIVSLHDFARMPADLERTVAELRAAAAGAAFVKLAVTPRSLADTARIVRLQRGDRGSPPLFAIGLGELGLATRLLAGRHGAPLVYGRVGGAEATGPGQQDVTELAALYRLRTQRPETAVAAVVGNPIAQSLGPRLHNTLLAHHGLDRVLLPLRASTLDSALGFAAELGIDALSVTLPFKEAAAAVASGALPGFGFPPPEGAVNTLVRGSDGWLAGNTDRIGFTMALERGAPELLAPGRTALVLGAGGAARTAVAVLVERGLTVTIASRSTARAEALARSRGARAVELARAEPARFDLVVNATPVGMQPDAASSPLPDGALRAGQVVLDVVYRPRTTRLLAQARAAGAVALDGLTMFLEQGLAQFRLFTGQEGDRGLARATLEAALQGEPG